MLAFSEKESTMLFPRIQPVHNYRNKANKRGLYKIHIRICIGNVCHYFEVKVPKKVTREEWNGKENVWVRTIHPYHFEINNAITEKLALLRELTKRYYMAQRQLTFTIISKELQKNENPADFKLYFAQALCDPPEALQPATLGRYRAALAALNNFKPEILFLDLNEKLFLELTKYLKKQMSLKGSTIAGYFNVYKKVVHWAQLDGYLTPLQEDAIFSHLHLPRGKPPKDHLDVLEIKAWKELAFDDKNNARLARVRDMFLLQIYTGFYYSDLKSLLKTELHKDPEYGYFINRWRSKNDHLAIVPLWKFPYSMEVIKKYYSIHPSDNFLLERETFLAEPAYNRCLKEIARILGWHRNVRNKLARQTNSQLYIRYGAKLPVVSRIMGHERQETTSAYFEVNLADVIEGIKEVSFDHLGIG
ncbi:phage integrase SAM-like domain-containing protein [Pseudobacter ginsenosidimutans]|nr:phage integrase SAM-like domain-containing protein [Pseudobacter ginsenosidimutans]